MDYLIIKIANKTFLFNSINYIFASLIELLFDFIILYKIILLSYLYKAHKIAAYYSITDFLLLYLLDNFREIFNYDVQLL